MEKDKFIEENLGACKVAPKGYDILKCPFQKKNCREQCKRTEREVKR